MEFVVDTNKIIATLLKSGKVRALFYSGIKLIVLKYSIDEILSNEKLIKRFGKDFLLRAFNFFVSKNPNVIQIDHKTIDKEIRRKAYEIAKEFDPKDTPFIALALKLNIPIWTNDKPMIIHGLKSGKYLALDTQAVEDLLKGKSLEEVKKDLRGRYL